MVASKFPFFRKVNTVEIYLEHRILMPVFLQLRYHQAVKKFLAPLEIGIQRAYQQALPKTTGTAKKTSFGRRYQTINQIGLIHIDPITFYYLIKTLYANGIFHHSLFLKWIVNAKITTSLRINNKSGKTNSFQVNFKDKSS